MQWAKCLQEEFCWQCSSLGFIRQSSRQWENVGGCAAGSASVHSVTLMEKVQSRSFSFSLWETCDYYSLFWMGKITPINLGGKWLQRFKALLVPYSDLMAAWPFTATSVHFSAVSFSAMTPEVCSFFWNVTIHYFEWNCSTCTHAGSVMISLSWTMIIPAHIQQAYTQRLVSHRVNMTVLCSFLCCGAFNCNP